MSKEATFKGKGNINNIANFIREELISGAATCELSHSSINEINGVSVGFLVFEQFYYRAGSYAALAIELIEFNGNIKINAVSSGGGSGLFKISYNAEGAFLNRLVKSLENNGFKVENIQSLI